MTLEARKSYSDPGMRDNLLRARIGVRNSMNVVVGPIWAEWFCAAFLQWWFENTPYLRFWMDRYGLSNRRSVSEEQLLNEVLVDALTRLGVDSELLAAWDTARTLETTIAAVDLVMRALAEGDLRSPAPLV